MQKFTKAERLSSKITIDKLVEKGKSIQLPPFKIKCLEDAQSELPVKIIISVPKRLFKKAVHRNRLKRIIRETYRKNKLILYEGIYPKKIVLMFIYTSKKMEEYAEIENKMIAAMQKISELLKY